MQFYKHYTFAFYFPQETLVDLVGRRGLGPIFFTSKHFSGKIGAPLPPLEIWIRSFDVDSNTKCQKLLLTLL